MTNRALPSIREYPLGAVGLALMLVVGRLVEVETAHVTGVPGWIRRTVARAGLNGVSFVGAAIDGLSRQGRTRPLPARISQAG